MILLSWRHECGFLPPACVLGPWGPHLCHSTLRKPTSEPRTATTSFGQEPGSVFTFSHLLIVMAHSHQDWVCSALLRAPVAAHVVYTPAFSSLHCDCPQFSESPTILCPWSADFNLVLSALKPLVFVSNNNCHFFSVQCCF